MLVLPDCTYNGSRERHGSGHEPSVRCQGRGFQASDRSKGCSRTVPQWVCWTASAGFRQWGPVSDQRVAEGGEAKSNHDKTEKLL